MRTEDTICFIEQQMQRRRLVAVTDGMLEYIPLNHDQKAIDVLWVAVEKMVHAYGYAVQYYNNFGYPNSVGVVDHARGSIFIDPNHHQYVMLATLLHETGHVILREKGVSSSRFHRSFTRNAEEIVVEAATAAILLDQQVTTDIQNSIDYIILYQNHAKEYFSSLKPHIEMLVNVMKAGIDRTKLTVQDYLSQEAWMERGWA